MGDDELVCQTLVVFIVYYFTCGKDDFITDQAIFALFWMAAGIDCLLFRRIRIIQLAEKADCLQDKRHELDGSRFDPNQFISRGVSAESPDDRIFTMNIATTGCLHDVIAESFHLEGNLDFKIIF